MKSLMPQQFVDTFFWMSNKVLGFVKGFFFRILSDKGEGRLGY